MIQQNIKVSGHGTALQGVQLVHFENGRYGYSDPDGKRVEFTCGHCVDVLIRDGDMLRWMPTRFEHDGMDYYLVGYPRLHLCGLTVRERRERR